MRPKLALKLVDLFLSLAIIIFVLAMGIVLTKFRRSNSQAVGTVEFLRQQAISDAQKQGAKTYQFNWGGVLPPLGM